MMMKKFLVLSLFIAQFVIFTASAVEPTVVIDEDFSLFTAGSEENPDGNSITTSSFYVESKYTKIPKWIGYNVCQAGGVCALLEYFHPDFGKGYGYISTPEMELYGETTVTFRARRAYSNPSSGDLDLALCDNTSGRLETTNFTLGNEWKEYTWTTDEAVFNDKCIFQFTPMRGEILLDDIKVVRKRTVLPVVEVVEPENISTTEFKAKWVDSKLNGKTGYYLSVYYKDWPETIVEPGSILFDCESLNLEADNKTINDENPGYPEGWTIDVSSQGQKDVCTEEGNRNSGDKALNFDAVGDYILTSESPAPIHKFSFWIKPSTMESEDYVFSLVCVEVKSGDEWTVIAAIPNYWMEEEGGYYVLEGDVLGDYVTQIRMSCTSINKVTFAIDDIQMDYASQQVPYELITDTFVTENYCVVTDIDPTKEHYYNVKQTDGEVVSAPSKDMWVDGLIGLAPTTLPATDVSETGFTANWERLPHAGNYKLYVNQEYETKVANEEVVILSEDFNSINKGTLNSPYNPNESIYNLADNSLAEFDWMLTAPYMVKGMAGTQGSSDYSAGLVISPQLILGNNPIAVDFTLHNVEDNDVIWVIVMEDYTDSKALYGLSVECGEASGSFKGSVVFPNMELGDKPVYLAFMSQVGAFFIDDVKVIASVAKAGSVVERPYKLYYTEENSLAISRIRKEAPVYNYSVMARRTKNFIDYVSEISDKTRVQLYDTSVDAVAKDDNVVYVSGKQLHAVLAQDATIEVYDIAGFKTASVDGKQGDNVIDLNAGIYVVRIDNKTYKLIIK